MDSVTGNIPAWLTSCLRTEDDVFFRRFRSDQAFLDVVEGTPETGGIWNLKRLLKDDLFRKALPLIQQSDHVGSPLRRISFGSYSLSPTTIRYANNAANCFRFFPSLSTVYEIGAGYGGDCKIFNDFAKVSGRTIDWSIFDLPTSQRVIEKFLAQFGYSARFHSLDSFMFRGPALIISNGALSEMRGSLLERYIEKVVAPCQFGYFITNFDTHSKPFGGWSTDEFLTALNRIGKSPRELHTESYLSYFDKQAGSRLIVFGTDVPYRIDYRRSDVVKIIAIQKAYGLLRRLTNYYLS